MATANQILEIAKSQIGTKEYPPFSNSVLYNTWYYGRDVSGNAYPWCCAFVCWVFNQANASKLFFGGGKTASCSTLYSYHKLHGQSVSKDYKLGDIIFFDFSGKKSKTEHVGILESFDGKNVVTIDGNTGTTNEANGGAVMRRTRSVLYVSAAFRPNYEEEEEEVTYEDWKKFMTQYRKELQDNDSGSWSKEDRAWGVKNGLMKGSGTTSNGEENYMWEDFLTREQAITLFHRYDEMKG